LTALFYQQTNTAVLAFSETPAQPNINTVEPSPVIISTPTSTDTANDTPTPLPLPTNTDTPGITPLPRVNNIITPVFDQFSPISDCWINDTNSEDGLQLLEGFSRREDNNWRFNVQQEINKGYYTKTNFSQCFTNKQLSAFAANIWVDTLELQRGTLDPGKDTTEKGIGFFIENTNGIQREYTIWVDDTSSMHLLIHENDTVIDNSILIVNAKNLRVKDVFPRLYATFPIQIFLEINNQGLDILYLREGPGQKVVDSKTLDSQQMIRIDGAVLKTLGEIKSYGLIGYGGEIRTIIWPIVFFGEYHK
jgi:hypothetical protein